MIKTYGWKQRGIVAKSRKYASTNEQKSSKTKEKPITMDENSM